MGGLLNVAARRSGRAPMIALATVTALPLAACESALPFYRPGEGSPDDPVVGLSAPAPYVQGDPLSGRRPSPAPPAPVPPSAGAYAATGPGMLSPMARTSPARMYIPDAARGTVDIIDQATLRVIRRVDAGPGPARVVPSWNLHRLWVVGTGTLVPLSPRTGRAGPALPVTGPDGLFFTPDGRDALMTASMPARIDVRDPDTMRLRDSLPMPCTPGQADFSADGAFLVASCTRASRLVRVHPATRKVTGMLRLPPGSRPGQLRLSPDGALFSVADAAHGGVWLIDARRFRPIGFVPTGAGARGLAVSRDASLLFVLGDGTLSAVDVAARRRVLHRHVPGGGSPVPGGVSSDGAALWLAEPSSGLLLAVSTRTGDLLRKARVGGRPLGLCVHPQPGRHSLGGTGLYR